MKKGTKLHKSQVGPVDPHIVDATHDGDSPHIPRTSEGQFHLAFGNAPIGMAIVGLDGRLMSANKELCNALGYKQRELLEKTLLDIAHPDDAWTIKSLAAQLFDGVIPSFHQEHRFISRDGQTVWFELALFLIRDSHSNPLYGLAMLEDITDRRSAELALRTSEERYRSFIVNSSEGIWRIESDHPIDCSLSLDEQSDILLRYGCLAECNDAMAHMLGENRAEDVTGLRLEDLRRRSSANLPHTIRLFIENGYRLQNIETQRVDAEGRTRHFSSNLIGIVVNGYLLRAWGTQRDITKRHLADVEIKRSQKQLRALVAYLEAVRENERANLARELHDVFGQALTGLKMDVSWLARKLSGLAAETQGEEMHSRLSQMTQLLDDTIVATKQLSTELRPGVLDKLGLAAAIEWQCEEFSKRKGISCVYRLPDEQLRLSAEEATTLFRILQEALTNVGRHSGADNAFVELTVTGSSATLIVRDFGKGISEAEATAPTSLGLLGMRERAQMLGGTLEVESQTGVGTIIRTTIPVGT